MDARAGSACVSERTGRLRGRRVPTGMRIAGDSTGFAARILLVGAAAGILAGAIGSEALVAGAGFSLLAFAIVLFAPRLRESRELVLLLLAAVTVSSTAAFLNAFLLSLPGTRPDSETFHVYAETIAATGEFAFGVDYVFFVNILAVIYRVFDADYYLASSLSVCMFAVAARLFLTAGERLEIGRRGIAVAFVFFAFSPALVFIGSAPLREVYQLVLLQAIFLLALADGMQARPRRILAVALFVLLAGLLHKALIFAGVGILAVVFAYLSLLANPHTRRRRAAAFIVTFAAVVAGFSLIVVFNEYGRSLVYGLVDKDLFWTIWHYRTSVDNIGTPSSAYDIDFHYEPLGASLVSVAKVYAYYLFYPLIPTAQFSGKELYALAESWYRVACLSLVAFALVRFGEIRRSPHLWLLLGMFIVVTFIWSLGTTNYGQAIRHHVTTNWMLALGAASAVYGMLRLRR